MKPIRNLLSGLLIIVGFIGLLNPLHAQETATPVQSATPDSIVQLTAQSQGLNLVSPDDLPEYGTFWMVTTDGLTAPMPCPPQDPSLPVYAITNGQFIVDATDGKVTTEGQQSVADAVAALAGDVEDLINQVQTPPSQPMMTGSRMAGGMMAMDEGGGDFTPDSSFDTNGLWLQITNYDGNFAYVNLNNATDQVYAVWTTTNLLTGWQVEAELWPATAQTNVLPFTVLAPGQPVLFVRAEDWTGVDSDGDGVPDWWSWLYWGTINLPDTNLDYSGNGDTFAQDYSNSIAPTVFSFTGIEVANNYVNVSSAPAQLDVSGSPCYMAISVDDTNYSADANWQTYNSSNVTVNLGLTEGWHDVWIGLRGHGDDPSSAVWWYKRLKLDFTPPLLVITNPANATVDVPVIQLQGFSPESLQSISYDITDASGLTTNQLMMVEGEDYSTNTWEFTTNSFQAFDVPLTNGVNVITIHATDLAGNVTTTNFSFTLDYSGKTNPPDIQLLWPLSGAEICGSNIVCRGQVNDSTATVSVQLVDANGNTNSVGSLVGRDGVFYAGNLTLAAGTNQLLYTVTDAAGNVATTNITVVTSDLGLTLDPVIAGQTLVTGTIDDDSYTVYVNGIAATNNGDGTWSATISPIGVGGGAVVVNATKDGDEPALQQIVQPPQGVFISSYHSGEHIVYPPVISGGPASQTGNIYMDWQDGGGGNFDSSSDTYYTTNGFHIDYFTDWASTSWPQGLPDGETANVSWNDGSQPTTNSYESGQPDLLQEHRVIAWANDQNSGTQTADTEMKLATGGNIGSTRQNLWKISGSAREYFPPWSGGSNAPVAFSRITILGQTLDTNGNMYVLLPDNDPTVVTPMVAGIFNYSFGVSATKFTPAITANGITLSNDVVVPGADFCVGESITFDVAGLPGPVFDLTAVWTLPGTFVNTNSDPNCNLFYEENAAFLRPPQGTSSTHCWYVKDGLPLTASVHVYYRCTPNGTLFDETITGKFNVHRPATSVAAHYEDGTPTAQILGGTLSLGVSGVTNDMSFKHQITTDGFCAGQAGYVQVINSADIETYPPISPINDALDNALGEFPRGTPGIPANTNTSVWFYDAPSVGLPSSDVPVSEDISFSTYLMFKPSGGIWVPLRLITWELHDHADPEWTPYNSNGGNTTKITGDNSSIAFPDWTTHYP